jgi:hypothetical protein
MHRSRMIVPMLFCWLLASGICWSHPASGYSARELSENYGTENWGLPAQWSTDDLQFTRDFPAASSLTETEKYMLAGCSDSEYGTGLTAWYENVYQFVCAYYSEKGSIPDTITPEAISEVYAGDTLQWALDVLRNPLTDAYPRLNADNPSPGDFYIRPLTDAEMQYYSTLNPWYRYVWYGKKNLISDLDAATPQRFGPVFFIRMYGLHGVLLEYFNCSFTLQN